MKQKLAILVATLLMLTCMAPAVWAADTEAISIQLSRDVKTKVITISGVYQNGYGQMMTITAEFQSSEDETVVPPDGPVYLNQFFVKESEGGYSHAFRMAEDCPIGTYLITVTAADTGEQNSVPLEFVSEGKQLEAVERLRDAANGSGTAAEIAAAVGRVIEADKIPLMLDLTDYLALGSRKSKVNELVAAGVKQKQPQDVIEVSEIFKPAMAVGALIGCGAENVAAVLTKYQDMVKADLSMLETLNDNAKTYAADWLQKGDYAVPQEIEQAFVEAVILGCVSKPQNYTEIRQALLVTYQSAVALDTTQLNQVKDQSAVFKAMLNINYTSLEQIKSTFHKAVADRLTAEKNNGGSIGGIGGGGGGTVGGNMSGRPALPGQNTTPNTNTPQGGGQIENGSSFIDMEGAPWAQTSVNLLYDKGIVKAAADGKFHPNDAITRAEFAALVVRAFGLEDAAGELDFTDVSMTDWYYSVVAAAAKNGIVQGDGNGAFQPEANISRQDMAVMIDRAAKLKHITFEKGEPAAVFSDTDQIASYAVEAVGEMALAGIINGNGDGTFAPQANATRAQSAKMIAAVLTVGR